MTTDQLKAELQRIKTALAALAIIADTHGDTALAELTAHLSYELDSFENQKGIENGK